jgi:hypothetical protein
MAAMIPFQVPSTDRGVTWLDLVGRISVTTLHGPSDARPAGCYEQ